MQIETRLHKGSTISNNPVVVNTKNPLFTLKGMHDGKISYLPISEEILSRHSMFIGSTGCGKSNAIFQFVEAFKKKLGKNDAMIVFDTKGDYLKEFFSQSDLIIGNSPLYASISQKWNLLLEITCEKDYRKWSDNDIKLHTDELCRSLFEERVKNTTNAFFPNAARSILVGIIVSLLRMIKNNPSQMTSLFHNNGLKKTLTESNIDDIYSLLEKNHDLHYLLSYIEGNGEQALGVISEMYSVINDLLIGIFSEKGLFSIRDFVRQRGGRTLFIEYDLGIGNTLTPIYRTLIDLAIKEVLSRNSQKGNLYIICDEFRLLPHLQHIDDAVNFGRSYGIKIIAGLQSIEQMYEVYGSARGKNIIAGFSSVYAFRANDVSTREYYTGMHGQNIVIEQHQLRNGTFSEEKRVGHVVEDWDVKNLKTGEAIITFPEYPPFLFRFDEYIPMKERKK